MRSRVLALLPVLAAGLLAGCGSDSDSSSSSDDDAAIAKAVQTGFTTTDVEVKCGKAVTTAFIKRVYGDAATCRKAEADPDDDKTTGATASNTKVDGEKATTTVRLKGGDNSGATGTVSLAKEDGTWRVDDLEADLLRSELAQGISGASASKIPGLEDPSARTCVTKQIDGLGDADLQRLAYGAIAESSAAQSQLTQIITGCISESSAATGSGSASGDDGGSDDDDKSVSFLRKKFEEGLTKSIRKDGATKAQADCVKKALRKTISDQEIVDEIGKKKTSAELTNKAAIAIQGCRDASS